MGAAIGAVGGFYSGVESQAELISQGINKSTYEHNTDIKKQKINGNDNIVSEEISLPPKWWEFKKKKQE